LPQQTRLIIGYSRPYRLERGQSALQIAGKVYKDPETIYYFPSKKLFRGSDIKDFQRLQTGTLIFIPATG
jgi:hypothetical protein